MDDDGRPVEVPQVETINEEQERRYNSALRRRELRLILSGRMKPEDAKELKAIFLTEG
ncbi:MAG: hypothetical protein R2794_06375 [Chitinophagales bacterium]